MTKYLVTGATGQLGRLVIDHLVTRVDPADVVALVRKEADGEAFAAKGVAVRVADYDQPGSLDAALAGIDRVLLISSPVFGQRVAQHKAVIDAAKAAGASFIAYTSLLDAANNPMKIAEEHKGTEAVLADAGIAYTLLRNPWYTENFLMNLPQALGGGQIFGAAGEGRFSPATRADLAEAAAIVLAGGHDGAVLELAGDEAFTMSEFAAKLGGIMGKPVTYISIPEAALKGGMLQAGLPEPVADILADADANAANGTLYSDDKTLSRLLGRPTTPLAALLGAALAQPPA